MSGLESKNSRPLDHFFAQIALGFLKIDDSEIAFGDFLVFYGELTNFGRTTPLKVCRFANRRFYPAWSRAAAKRKSSL